MKMYELLEMVDSNVVLAIFDKDNSHIITFAQKDIESWEYVKEHHFKRVIEEITPKDNMLVVKLKNYSQFEWKAVEEMQKLKVHSEWSFLHSVFFNLDNRDLKDKEELKKYVLTQECVRKIKYLSKEYNNGWGGAYLVVLNNGEWFEVFKKVWGEHWQIGNHNKEQEKDYFQKYLKQKN